MDIGISKLMTLSNGPVGGGIGGAPGMGGAIGGPDQQQLGGLQDSIDFSGEALTKVAEVVGAFAASAIKGLLAAFGGGGGEGMPGADGAGAGGGVPAIGGGGSGAPSALQSSGGGGGGGGSAPLGSSESAGGAAPEMSGVTGGGANASVEMAKKYLGNSAISLKGKLANYTAAGGTGNDCADFVSAILANTQGFKKQPGDASVATFKKDLEAQGWRKVDKSQAKAGDVVIFNGNQHTELVTKDGGKEAIGSNGGATNQTIKTDSLSWGSQEYYHKG